MFVKPLVLFISNILCCFSILVCCRSLMQIGVQMGEIEAKDRSLAPANAIGRTW
jgi:hypothetical protein